jgi:hypothetical protein
MDPQCLAKQLLLAPEPESVLGIHSDSFMLIGW